MHISLEITILAYITIDTHINLFDILAYELYIKIVSIFLLSTLLIINFSMKLKYS